MRAPLAVCSLLACVLLADPASGGEITGSRFALATLRVPAATRAGEPGGVLLAARPEPGLLAQRAITREWGQSDDSTYIEFDVPGYTSEGWAMFLSGVAPGAGHFYLGESSAWLFVLAEAAAWTSRIIFRDRARDLQRESIEYAGSPYDSTANWSFTRYFRATHGDTLALQQLYAGDPDAFYRTIGFDERYQSGWSGDAFVVRDAYQMLENRHQRHLKRSRYATGGVVLIHVAAALDALQAARRNNLPLQRNLRLRLEGSLGVEGEAMSVALERMF